MYAQDLRIWQLVQKYEKALLFTCPLKWTLKNQSENHERRILSDFQEWTLKISPKTMKTDLKGNFEALK